MKVTPQDILKRQLKFLNVDKYHEQGFTGKGLVAFNSESHIGESNKHGRMTNMVSEQFAPDITIINGTTGGRTSGSKVIEYYVITTDGEKYDFEEFIVKFDIKFMTTSLGTAQANKAIQDYLKGVQERTGLIMFCAAGNEGSAGADGKYVKNDTAIAVGAAYIYENGTVDITHYSAIDDEVDFIAPMGTYSGTSAASPALTGMTACLISKYGDMTQKECVEVLKSIAMDIGVEGKDPKFGWGLPILPLTDRLPKLDELRNAKVEEPKPELPVEEPKEESKEPIKEEPTPEIKPNPVKSNNHYLVIFDDGHGVYPATVGKRTPIFPDGTFMHENDFNSAVVALIYKKLKRIPNVDVAFTAEENYDVPLNTRIIRANQAWQDHQDFFGKANSKCILISVHANAYGDGKTFNTAKGVSTFCCSSPPAERRLAETIHRHLKGGTTQIDRGIQEVCFDILRGNMTSCLVECAFMTNLEEANLLKTEDFRQECADEIVAGILEYFGINQPKKEVGSEKTEFKRYSNGMTEMKKHPSKLTNEIVNKRIWDIVEFTDCMNGTFFYPDGKGGLYSTSILYVEGKTYQDTANHYYNFGTPQSVFIVYKDNTVDLKRIKFLSELDLSKVRLAIGGVGLRNTQDPNFYYSPVTEGFKAGYNLKGEWKDFTDVLKKRNKSVLGYNKRLNKIYMLTVPSVAHGELIKIISDNSTGEAYDIAISVDGGGSTFMDTLGEYVFQGENTRRIHNILRFK